MLVAAVVLSAFCGLARAAGPVIPAGPAPARRSDVPATFTLNAEVLQRYGYTLDGYNALKFAERDRVSDWIELLERERQLAKARVGAGAPHLTLTPQTQAAIDRIKASLSPDFDGKTAAVSGGPDLVPSVSLLGPGDADGNMAGTLRRISLTDAKNDLTLSYGQLGLDGRSPLVEPSPYAGIEKGWDVSGRSLDWSGRASAYALNLGARLYTNDAPGLDARIDQGLANLRNAAPDLGLSNGDVNGLADSFSYSTSFDRQWMFLGSMMGRVGRAYSLFGNSGSGVDWGWSAMGLLRVDQIFPNASLDQTASLRLRSDAEHGLGVFAGVTEGVGLFAKTAVVDSLAAGSVQTDVQPQAAPHVTVAAWGMMPYLSGVKYTVSAGQQWNPWTTVESLSASALANAGKGVKVGVFGSYSDESGPGIEYDRTKAAAGVMVKPSPGLGLSAQYFNQIAAYGDARVQNQGVMLGLTMTETGPGGRGSATLESLFGGKDRLLPNKASSEMVQLVQAGLDDLRGLKDAGLSYTGGAAQGWQDVQSAWNKLDPDVKQSLGDLWRLANPGGSSLAQIMATKPSTIDDLNRLVNLLSDTQVWERLLVRYIRHQILEQLAASDISIPILGQKLDIHMNAPMVLAAAHAYGLSLTPVAPITANDARESLDAYLLNQGAAAVGCKTGAEPQAATDCILSTLPKDKADQLRKTFGNDLNVILKTAVGWPSDVIRTEMNQLGLQVILAAETLNELTVDKGERIGDLNMRALQASFDRLDERTRRDESRVLTLAEADLRDDLKAQDAAMRVVLTDYGASRLAWLQGQAAWPAGVRIAVKPEDWVPILAVYGDARTFDFILMCKARLAAKGGAQNLLITFDHVSPLGGMVVTPGNPAVIRLPPKAIDLTVFDLSL